MLTRNILYNHFRMHGPWAVLYLMKKQLGKSLAKASDWATSFRVNVANNHSGISLFL